MNIALVGYELEGRAAYIYWSNLGAQITICDAAADKQVPDGVDTQLGDDYLQNLDRFDVVWRTAGINPQKIIDANPGIEDKITTTMNEFLRVCPTKHVIGVTGTKGKGTTSTLITKMLEADGKQVFLGGNIGVSPFEFLPKLNNDSFVVLELSSFQLADLNISPPMAVCLMVVPEHLNWHNDMDEYIIAKANIFKYQKQQDTAVYFAQNDLSKKIAGYSPGNKIPYFAQPGAFIEDHMVQIAGQSICDIDDIQLLGKHNWENICAAITVLWQITQNIEALRSVITTFSGLPHRLEVVRDALGIKYYNDSFASTPDSAIAAMDAITASKVMILGGFDRNLPLEHLAKAAVNHNEDIRKIIIIGNCAPRLAEEFEKVGFSNYFVDESKSMHEIVASANTFAHNADAVVLSPGFPSFDMFKNFEDRGNQFKDAVNSL